MAGILDKIGKIFHRTGSSEASKRRKLCHHIKFNEDPNNSWSMIGELGDGAFGKVYKVSIVHYIVDLIEKPIDYCCD